MLHLQLCSSLKANILQVSLLKGLSMIESFKRGKVNQIILCQDFFFPSISSLVIWYDIKPDVLTSGYCQFLHVWLGKSSNLYEHKFPHLEMGTIISTLQGCYEVKYIKHLAHCWEKQECICCIIGTFSLEACFLLDYKLSRN